MTHRVIVTFQKHPDGASDWGFTVNGVATRDITLNSADQITWELDNVSSIAGTNWPQTHVQEGIVFKPPWTAAGNAQPTLNASNQFQVNDNGPFESGQTFKFAYTVFIATPGGHIHHTDPDVTNTPPP